MYICECYIYSVLQFIVLRLIKHLTSLDMYESEKKINIYIMWVCEKMSMYILLHLYET